MARSDAIGAPAGGLSRREADAQAAPAWTPGDGPPFRPSSAPQVRAVELVAPKARSCPAHEVSRARRASKLVERALRRRPVA